MKKHTAIEVVDDCILIEASSIIELKSGEIIAIEPNLGYDDCVYAAHPEILVSPKFAMTLIKQNYCKIIESPSD